MESEDSSSNEQQEDLNERNSECKSNNEGKSFNMNAKQAGKTATSDSSEGVHVTTSSNRTHLITRATDGTEKAKLRLEPASNLRGESLGRGYRAPQWPWLPFTVADMDSSHTSRASSHTASIALTSLQVEL